MFRLSSSGAASRYTGHVTTFHRIDSRLIKSPSVGIPWRLVILVLAGIVLVAAGYSSIDMIQADTLIDRAVQLLDDGDRRISLQFASDLSQFR